MPTKNKILVALILLMLGVLSIFGYLIYQGEKAETQIQNQTPTLSTKGIKTYPAELAGKVYLTLKEKNSEKQGIYYFDLDKNELVEVYTSEECEIIGGGLNSTGERMAYTSNCQQKNKDYYQTFLINLNTKDKKALNETRGGIEKGAVFSADDKKIINMNSVKGENDTSFVNWFILVNNLEGKEKFVATNSTQPAFSDNNNKVLGLRKDGLYLYDIENQQGERIFSLGIEKDHLNLNYDLSDKKNKLVVLDNISENKKIIIYEIDSWNDLVLNEKSKIDFSQHEIILSPKFNSVNDKYVIVKKIDSNKNKTELIVYNTKNGEKHLIVELDEYESDQVLINDWK